MVRKINILFVPFLNRIYTTVTCNACKPPSHHNPDQENDHQDDYQIDDVAKPLDFEEDTMLDNTQVNDEHANGESEETTEDGEKGTGNEPEDEQEGSGQKPERKKSNRKRIFLKDMTPESKQIEIERRKQLKRDNSNLWHAKWHSKGVPKNDQEAAAQPEVPAEGHEAEPPEVQVEGHEAVAPATDDGNNETFKPDEGLVTFGITGDMRKVRAQFMTQWLEWKGSKDQKAAAKAWQESELRAQIMAARGKKQY